MSCACTLCGMCVTDESGRAAWPAPGVDDERGSRGAGLAPTDLRSHHRRSCRHATPGRRCGSKPLDTSLHRPSCRAAGAPRVRAGFRGADGWGFAFRVARRSPSVHICLLRTSSRPAPMACAVQDFVRLDPDYYISNMLDNNNDYREMANFLNHESFMCAVGRGRAGGPAALEARRRR